METTGKIIDVKRHLETGKMIVFVQIDDEPINELNRLASQSPLEISIKKKRRHRSKEANALMWHCITEIAVATKQKNDEVYKQMLKDYGKSIWVMLRPWEVKAFETQWKYIEVGDEVQTANGDRCVNVRCYFGSSLYNTLDFTRLLDGVIQEMVNLGLDPPRKRDQLVALSKLEQTSGVMMPAEKRKELTEE